MPKQYNSTNATLRTMSPKFLTRISISPSICFGKPCIRGTRIWVSLILDRLAGGETIGELLNDYPGIEKEDILACIAYGAEMSRGSLADISWEIGKQTEMALR
jgi:uncharacterized protein (DUF433 family)